MSDSINTTPLTPAKPAPLPPAVAAAIRSAAQKIEEWSHEAEYDAPTVTEEVAEEIITEALRPVLLGAPLSPFDTSVERVAPDTSWRIPSDGVIACAANKAMERYNQ